MATAKKETAVKTYIVKVKNNPNYCGVGAGGTQFAQGQAVVTNPRLVNWFKERGGYVVTEAKAE